MTDIQYSHMPILETKRCILRMMTLNDSHDLFEFYNNEKHLKFLPFKKHNNLNDTKNFIRSFFINNYKKGKIGHYAIVLKENNKVIGNIGFNNINPNDKQGEIGVCLNPNYCGNGIIHELLVEILNYGFYTLKLNRIYAIAFDGNLASINILKHYHFNYVGSDNHKLNYKGKTLNIKRHVYDMNYNDYLKSIKKLSKR